MATRHGQSGKKPPVRPPSPARPGPGTARGSERRREAAPRRRPARWLAAIGATLAGALATAWWLWPREPRLDLLRTADQNVLVVTIDTLRADALGSYGGRAATPNLDRLAADGLRYGFAHAHAVVTLPSHASILTGRYPFEHGVRDNSGFRVPAGTTTLATLLAPRGYATAAFIGGFPLDSQFGLDAGFATYDDRLPEVRGPADFAMAERPADAVVASALAWLRRQPSRWFAWVHVYDPHAPTRPPEPFASQYASDPYAGEVAFTDAALGPLLDHVRSLTDRPTLVVVTSDHGEALGDHGEATHGLFAYEATLRVPLIVAQLSGGQPVRRAGAGARAAAMPVQLVDLLPTVLDALDLEVPADLPGRSLARLTPADADVRASYFEALSASLNRGWAPLRGVLVGREKLVDLPLVELYDLAADPAEQANLIATAGARRAVLETRLRDFGPTAPGARQAEDPDTAARLRALGYASGRAAPKEAYTEDDDPKRLVAIDQAVHRGIQLFQEGRAREAAAVYQAVIAERPDMSLAYQHLAFLQWELGEFVAAIATSRTALERAGPDPEVEARLGIYLSETGSVAEALPLLERAVQHPAAGVDQWNALGIAYARAGQPGRALATFQRILELDARNAMALQNIASVHLAAGRLGDARAALVQALEVNPSWAPAYNGLGAVEIRLGNRQAAIDAWKRAVELDPSNFDALFNLATELANARDFAAARPYLERFARTAPPAVYAKDIARVRAILARPPAR